MTIEEIGSLVSQRLLQGVMNHQQFSNYYNFLGLEGYKLCHKYHFLEQNYNYKEFVDYYMSQYNKLVPKFSLDTFNSLFIIPQNWYEYSKEDMDINTRRNAIKTGLEKYVHWEKDTKKFLEDMYVEAFNIHEVGMAFKIKQCICNVEKQIQKAQIQLLAAKSTDFDLPTIISKQDFLIKKYKKKLKKWREEFNHYDKSQRG